MQLKSEANLYSSYGIDGIARMVGVRSPFYTTVVGLA